MKVGKWPGHRQPKQLMRFMQCHSTVGDSIEHTEGKLLLRVRAKRRPQKYLKMRSNVMAQGSASTRLGPQGWLL